MRSIDILRIAFSTFLNNKMRTLLTILGVAIGISTIVYLVSIGYGLQQITVGEIKSIKALTTFNVSTGNSNILALDKKAVNNLKKIDHVSSVDPLLSMSGQINIDNRRTDVLINAASHNYLDLESPKMTAGDIYGDDDEALVLTEVTANALNMKHDEIVGKNLTVIFYMNDASNESILVEKDLRVAGVIKDTSASYLYLPSGLIEIPDKVNYNMVKVNVDDSHNMDIVKGELSEIGYRTTSIGERIDEMNRVFNIAQLVLLVFGVIALMVASIGMFNTLTISLLERTKDIGIMKALGASDRAIYSIFLAESTLISCFGGVAGLVLSFSLGFLTNLLITAMAVKAGGYPVAIFQPPWIFVVAIFIFSIFVGIGTGIYPSRRAARLNPLDALRYE